jgi:TPR repeat protein
MLEIALNFLKNIPDIWIIRDVLSSAVWAVIVSVVSTIVFFLKRQITNSHKKSVLELLEGIGSSFTGEFVQKLPTGKSDDKKTMANFHKYFDKYTEPTFSTHRLMGDIKEKKKEKLEFDKLWNYLVDKKDCQRVLMVYAEAGMGKSRLLRYLTYKLLLHEIKNKNKDESTYGKAFFSHGVYYTEFINYSKIQDLINDIGEKKSKRIKYLLLDGFDECCEYLTGKDSVANLLKSLFDKLDSKNIKEGISRIIITSRVDMLHNEGNALKSLSIRMLKNGILEDQTVDVIKMDYFTKKQVIHRYSIISKLDNLKGRLNIIKKLRNHLKKAKEESILRVPFFIRYANDLFNYMEDDALNYLTSEAGLDIVVKSCIKKEYGLYTGTNGNKNIINEDEYDIEMMSVFRKTAFMMYNKDNSFYLSYEEYNTIQCKYQAEKERIFMVRLSKDGQDYFRFQHNLFNDYFLVYHFINDVIVNNDEISLDDRRKFLGLNDNDEKYKFRRRLYTYFLTEEQKYKEAVEKNVKLFSMDNTPFSDKSSKTNNLIEATSITITDDPSWNIDRIILLLPLMRSLYYRKFQIRGSENLRNYAIARSLELNKEALSDTSGALRFGKLVVLDATEGKIKIKEIENFEEIEKIYIIIDNINDFMELINTKIAKTIRLHVKIKSANLPKLVQMSINANLKEPRVFFENTITGIQIRETVNGMNNITEKILFLEQLNFIEINYSDSMNSDAIEIQDIFEGLCKRNPEFSDEFIGDLLRKQSANYGQGHPYTMYLSKLYKGLLFGLGICYYKGKGVIQNYSKAFKWFQKSANQGYDEAFDLIQRCADQGNVDAQYWLGICYYKGEGAEQDFTKAFKWFQKSANQGYDEAFNFIQRCADRGNEDAQYWLGIYYYKSEGVKQNYNKAFKWFHKATNQGNIYGQYFLGTCYYNGHGVKRDYDKAFELFKRSADQGYLDGQLSLGICYYKGYGVKRNYDKAFDWFKRSIDQDNSSKQYWLGICYYNGHGVKRDYDKAFELFKRSADQSHAMGQYWLGMCYYNGEGTKQDNVEAFYWFEKSATEGNANGQYWLGIRYYHGHGLDQDYNKAFGLFQRSADQGHTNGQYWLGNCYYNGHGVKRNYDKAFDWFMRSANQGDANGQCWLGNCYYKGHGVKRNYDKAFDWFMKSANQGDANGQCWLGNCYYDGHGVKQNYDKAFDWFMKSANQGDANGQCWLGKCYYNGHGVDQDYNMAFELFKRSADQGHTAGKYWLGLCYYNGEGTKQDDSEAFYFIQKSANEGDANGQYWLGICYYNGKDIDQDYNRAFEMFKISADQGHATGQYWLGICYYNSHGVKRNYDKAFMWFQKAANKGDAGAQYLLGDCYCNGKGTKRNYDKAFDWFKRSADQGHTSGQCWLGICYYNGLGVDQDNNDAFRWFQRSADQGNADGQHWLGTCYYHGKGVYQDYDKALMWFNKSVNQDNATGQCLLGICYYNGKYSRHDYAKAEAFELFRRSADQGHTNGQYWLGICYYSGHGVDQDYNKAFEWFMRSANKGDAGAQYFLGDCYYSGHGVDQDYNKAFDWFMRSANQGDVNGQCWLGNCYYNGHGVKRNYDKAFDWFKMSANKGDANGQCWLGTCYYNGDGVNQDYAKAVEWLEKAADQNHAGAKQLLDEINKELKDQNAIT